MDYILDICPKCMDKLYEREKPLDDNGKKYNNPVSGASCPNCGHRLIKACGGEKKPDSTVYDTTYKIFISYIPDGQEEEAVDIVMKLGRCSRDVALEKLNTEHKMSIRPHIM